MSAQQAPASAYGTVGAPAYTDEKTVSLSALMKVVYLTHFPSACNAFFREFPSHLDNLKLFKSLACLWD